MRPKAAITVPRDVVTTLSTLTAAVRSSVVLVGGWGVSCRLRMARSTVRPTIDIDVLLRTDARPARAALEAVQAVQSVPDHPCRLDGLPLLVDLLADRPAEAIGRERPGRIDRRITDADGLRLLVPPFGELLSRSAEPMRLVDPDERFEVVVLLPRAGALLAAKAANVALDFRTPEKRATDGKDAVRLIEAFGSLALLSDLLVATDEERADLWGHLTQLGAGGLDGQARAAGYACDLQRLEEAVAHLVAGCTRGTGPGSS